MSNNIPNIMPGQIPEITYWAWKTRISPMFWGEPGIGKSQGMQASRQFFLESLNREREIARQGLPSGAQVPENLKPLKRVGMIDRRLSQYEPVELRGIPRNVPALFMFEEAVKTLNMIMRMKAGLPPIDLSSPENPNHQEQAERSAETWLSDIDMTDLDATAERLREKIKYLVRELGEGTYHSIWSRPDLLPRVDRDGEFGVVVLDEFTQAPLDVQAAALELILDRRLGDYSLPPGWIVVAAGNQLEDRSGVYEMTAALANRFVHFKIVTTVDGWLDWGYENGINQKVLGFTEYTHGIRLHMFDPERDERIFATHRSWERVGKVLDLAVEGIPRWAKTAFLGGLLGIGLSAEFEFYCDVEEGLPNIDKMLADWADGIYFDFPRIGSVMSRTLNIDVLELNKEDVAEKALYDSFMREYRREKGVDPDDDTKDIQFKTELVTRTVEKEIKLQGTSLLYMLVSGIAVRTSEETSNTIWEISRALEKVHREFSVYLVINACRRNRPAMLKNRQEFMAWSMRNQSAMTRMGSAPAPQAVP